MVSVGLIGLRPNDVGDGGEEREELSWGCRGAATCNAGSIKQCFVALRLR